MRSIFRGSEPELESRGGTARGRRARESDALSAIDGFVRRGAASSRRRMIGGALLAVIVLAGISVALAWRQYDDAKSRALADLDARVVAVSAIVDTSFGGQIATLYSIAKAPAVVAQQTPQMTTYFKRLEAPGSQLFTGGLGWIDRRGEERASSSTAAARVGSLSDRGYFKQVLATGKPYVSAGLIGRRLKQPIVVIAVPTFDRNGDVSGVLAGSILLKTVGESRQALDLGFGGIRIIDRDGQLLLSGLAPASNKALLAQLRRKRSGVLADTRGLEGQSGDAVAFATSRVAGWTTVIDRPRATVFAAARRALVLELVSVGAAVLLVFAVLAFVLRRFRSENELQNERARSWSRLTRALTGASTPPEVADALLASLASGFSQSVAIVAFDDRDEVRVKAASRLVQARRIIDSESTLETIAPLGKDGQGSRLLEHDPSLRRVHAEAGRRLRALHSLPILGRDDQPVGTISLLSPSARLEPSEWALLESFADQAAQALQRALVFVHEHELAQRLQRSLLPDRLPSADGVELAGHYLAGGEAVEVGGDWYDAVRRPDGIIQLCVGDVSGRGIGAATVMGRHRNTFHAYAYDCVSPAEIIRRMLRHVSGDEMITVACVTLDPYTGELSYACAGHPPPLLLDRESGDVARLDQASAPPIGVAEAVDIVEAHLLVPAKAVLAMYTDGLIERRGSNIEQGIDLLGRVIASEAASTPDGVVTRISEAIGAPADDVALLIATLEVGRTELELEVPAHPSSLPAIRRRLRAWLVRRQLDEAQAGEIVIAVSEACNNAIEHAYDGAEGTIKLTLHDKADLLRVVVEDQGTWKDSVLAEERGRGIMLMRHLMHSAEIESSPSGTRVMLERRLRRGESEPLEDVPVGQSS